MRFTTLHLQRLSPPSPARRDARGTAAVELALVLGLLIGMMLAVVDLARWTLAAQGLHEAARLGARLAAVCDPQDPSIADRVRQRLNTMSGMGEGSPSSLSRVMPAVALDYEPSGCSAATCTAVRATLQGAAIPGVAPWWTGPLALPTAMVELPRESLMSTVAGRVNALCL